MEKCRIWLKKRKNLYGKKLEKCRICLESWRIYIKNGEEFLWKNDEFAWTSERIYMVQRYSECRFFGVNCILRYSKYRFSSSIPGMPGEAKFSIPYSVGGGPYIYTCCNVLGCSKCGVLHSWLVTVLSYEKLLCQ